MHKYSSSIAVSQSADTSLHEFNFLAGRQMVVKHGPLRSGLAWGGEGEELVGGLSLFPSPTSLLQDRYAEWVLLKLAIQLINIPHETGNDVYQNQAIIALFQYTVRHFRSIRNVMKSLKLSVW